MTIERVAYDELGLFHENAAEYGLPFDEAPVVRREAVEVEPGRSLSALVWGEGDPEIVLLHGGGQNAHTWDTVALALRSEEHTSELQSLMRTSYAVFCLKKKKTQQRKQKAD